MPHLAILIAHRWASLSPKTPMIISLIVSLLCPAAYVAGQSVVLSNTPITQRTSGGGGKDEITAIAINWQGDIATIGNADKGEQGGRDISLVIYDAQLNQKVRRYLGRKNDDGAGQIIALPDGRYLVAGYSVNPGGKTRSSYFGKKDGWILVLNERGETEFERILGTPDDDLFCAAAVDPDGNVWLAGASGHKAWTVRLNASFQVLFEHKWQYYGLTTQANALTITPGGNCYLTGSATELNRPQLWLAGISPQGKVITERGFPPTQAETGAAIVALNDSVLAVAGDVRDVNKRVNGFLCTLSPNGQILHYQSLGGKEYDDIQTLLRLHNNHLLIGGGSASFERGSRRISAWLAQVGQPNDAIQQVYYGSKLDDEVTALAEHPDGRIFAAGATARQILKMRQGWLFQLTDPTDRKAKIGSLQVRLQGIQYPAQAAFISNERAVIRCAILNSGEKGQCNLRAVVQTTDEALSEYLRLPAGRSVLFPPVAAQTELRWGIPLRFDPRTPPGAYTLQVQFYQGAQALGPPHPIQVSVGEQAAPLLKVSAVLPDSGFTIGKSDWVKVLVANQGSLVAQGVTVDITAPAGIQIPSQLHLGELPPGAQKDTLISLTPLHAHTGQNAAILQLRASDGAFQYSHAIAVPIAIQPPPASKTTMSTPPKQAVAVWVYPNPDNFDREAIVWNNEEITVQIKIVADQPVFKQNFCLEINGQPCVPGTKFDEVQIKGSKNSKTFSQTVRLQEGENVLKATLLQSGQTTQSETLTIVYTPSKPNLHIVAIGVPAGDLKYTSKDARDFAQALSHQRNMAFGKIFVDTLLTEDKTTKTEILKSLRRLQYRYADLQITPGDLLVIFVSGHGLVSHDGSFRLAAGDYDAPFQQETSLDFEQDLLNYVAALPCRKLFLVDACHSGTSSGAELTGILNRKKDIDLLVSCQATEYSYEDDHWQNGAFTAALVNGIRQFYQQQGTGIDANRDGALNLSELFGFIQTEVPALVEKKRPKPGTGQNPQLRCTNPTQPLLLFQRHP